MARAYHQVPPGLRIITGQDSAFLPALLQDRPRLIVCFHDQFDPASGGTSDMALRGLIRQVPVWLVHGEDLAAGRWLSLDLFPRQRASRARRELDTFSQSR
jgi:hypothetical protein